MNDHATPEEELPDEAPVPEDSQVESAQGEGAQAEAGQAEADEIVPADDAPALDIAHVKRVLEAALLSTPEPLNVQQLKRLFSGQVAADNIRKVLDELKDEWAERSIELTTVSTGWRFRVKPEFQPFLDRITNEKPPRYSRAVLETLAIVAYRQPVTRGDIEDIRGVAVSPATLNALVERGWVDVVGHRESPGKPALFATARKFLDDLNLRSLEELPALDELQSALESLAPAPEPAPAAQQQDLLPEEPSEPSPTEPEHAG
jgi:segregation and condensation protein B